MKVDKEKPPYLPKVAFVRLHTAGKEVKDYSAGAKGTGFTFNQFKHMKKADELWDGLELWVSMWDYDNHESWHLWNWKKEDDNRVMLAMYEAEQYNPFCAYEDDFEGFKADWEAGTYDPGCTYTFPIPAVEVLEVVQEEEDNKNHERVKKEVIRAKEDVFLKRRATKRKRGTGKRKEDRRAKEVGKRKNRHCQSKQEVLQSIRQQRAAEQQEKRKPILKRQLQTINSIKPSIDRARAQMREKNRRESKSDIV